MKYFQFVLLLTMTQCMVHAQQKFSLTANFSAFSIDNANSGDDASIDYDDSKFSSTVSLNARLFSENLWAGRLGVERENISYEVGQGSIVDSLYNVDRKDFTAILGLEKHINIGALTIYPGIFTAITFPGNQDIVDEIEDIDRDKLRAGLGLLLGANIKLLKVLRVGFEFDMKYDRFKSQVWDQLGDNFSDIRLRNLDYTGAFTIGLAF